MMRCWTRTRDSHVAGPLGEPELELFALGHGTRFEGPKSEPETLLTEQLRKASAGSVGVGGRAHGLVYSPQHLVRLVNYLDRRDARSRGSS
jgi:hypothetical protein